jgi:hypothetical protein
VDTHARFIEAHLSRQRWFAGAELSMADIQMSFPAMALLARGGVENLPHLTQWVQRVEQRPAWQKAVERGGRSPYPANKLLLKPMTGENCYQRNTKMLPDCAWTITFAHRLVIS